MHPAKVSIIALCYNQASFLEETLSSIINQNYENFEIIIIDDASTDNSVFIIDQWIKRNSSFEIKRLINSTNLGICKSLNLAIKNCKGTIIKPIACDDILDEEYLKEAINFFELNTDIELLCTDMCLIDAQSNIIHYSNWDYNKIDITNEYLNNYINLLKGPFLNTPTLSFRTTLFSKIGYFDEDLIFEDWDFLLRAKRQTRFGFIKKSLVSYRIHQDNMHNNFGKLIKYSEDKIKILVKQFITFTSEDEGYLSRIQISNEIAAILMIDEEIGFNNWRQNYTKILKDNQSFDPLVSVLITVFNSENYIENALYSIVLQSYKNVEIIIINDGSTDNSLQILEKFKFEYDNIFVYSMQNAGIAAAANYGLTKCKGKYIARMDSDDISHPLRIEKQVEFLESYSDFLAVSSWVTEFNLKGEKSIRMFRENSDKLKSILPFDNPVPHASALFKGETLVAIRYDENYKIAEDYNLWLDLFTIGKVNILQESLYFYRKHSNNITNLINVKKFPEMVMLKGLSKIRVIPNKEQKLLHYKFATLNDNSGSMNYRNMIDLHNWLILLLQKNNINEFYSQTAFYDELQRRWLHHYYLNKRFHGIKMYIKLRNSPFHKVNRWQLIKDSIKGILDWNAKN